MATYKYVYFSDSNPEKWFETREEAERYDKAAEVVGHLLASQRGDDEYLDIVNRIMERYNIEQRYDYIEQAKDDQDETTTV